jgi:hypothetical protein
MRENFTISFPFHRLFFATFKQGWNVSFSNGREVGLFNDLLRNPRQYMFL